MFDIKLWIDLVGVVMEVVLLAYFMHALLGSMGCRWYWGIGVYGFLGCCLWGISYGMTEAYWRTACYLLLVPMLVAPFYHGKRWTNMFAAFCFMLLGILLEYIVHAIFMLTIGHIEIINGHDVEFYILGLFFSKSLMIVMSQILVGYLKRLKNKSGELTMSGFGVLLFYPLANMIVLLLLYRVTIRNDELYGAFELLMIAILLWASSIGIFILFNKIRLNNQLEQENALANQQLTNQQRFYSAQAEQQQSLRAWNHDFKNQLVVIAGYIQNGQPQQALEYIQRAEIKLNQSTAQLTGNIALDAVLANKQQIAEEMQIEMQYTVILSEPLKIEAMDVVVVLANGLDNALEAVAKLPELAGQVITCSMTLQQNWLRIIITNPVAQRVNINGQKLPTDKGDALRHGTGLTNVRHIVECYQGTLSLKCDEHQFIFTAIMANA